MTDKIKKMPVHPYRTNAKSKPKLPQTGLAGEYSVPASNPYKMKSVNSKRNRNIKRNTNGHVYGNEP